MIEFRRKKSSNSDDWREHDGKRKLSDFYFKGFEYKIFNKVFSSPSPEFEKLFTKYLFWRKLND